jgi:hypothetical protein
VVTTKRDDTRERPALDGGATLVGICRRSTGQEVEVSLLNLVKGPGVVISSRSQCPVLRIRWVWSALRSDRDITTVKDSSPAVERVGGQGDVVSSTNNSQSVVT